MVIMNSIIRDQGERGVSLLSDTMSAFSTSQRLDWPEEAGAGTLRLFNLLNCSNSQGREPRDAAPSLSGESGVFSVSGPLVLTSCGSTL